MVHGIVLTSCFQSVLRIGTCPKIYLYSSTLIGSSNLFLSFGNKNLLNKYIYIDCIMRFFNLIVDKNFCVWSFLSVDFEDKISLPGTHSVDQAGLYLEICLPLPDDRKFLRQN